VIKFSCPRCYKVYEVPSLKAGNSTRCGRCRKRLRIPSSILDEVVPAALVDDSPTYPSPCPPQAKDEITASSQPEPVSAAVSEEPLGEFPAQVSELSALPSDDPEYESPPRQGISRPLLVSLSIVGGLALVAVIAVILNVRNDIHSKESTDRKTKAGADNLTAVRLPPLPKKPSSEDPQETGFTTSLKGLPPFEPDDVQPVDRTGEMPGIEPIPTAEGPDAAKTDKPSKAGDSIEDFTSAIALNPKDAAAYYNRGKACLAKGDFEQAIDDLNQAIQLDSRLSDAYQKRELAYKKRLQAGPIPGYKHETIEGFHVLIANSVFKHNDDSTYERKPLDVLKLELGMVTKALPRRAVRALQTILIWVEWHDENDPDLAKNVLAKFYGASGDKVLWALTKHKHPLKANSVEIINMQALTAEHQPSVKVERCVILHELSHAVHFLLIGSDNVQVKLAYQQAMDRRLYDSSRNAAGDPVKPYARTNEYEYFAELSCAYFDKLNYFPFTREELKKYDPIGFRMMELTWSEASKKEGPGAKPATKGKTDTKPMKETKPDGDK
jgi:hypothetical protein